MTYIHLDVGPLCEKKYILLNKHFKTYLRDPQLEIGEFKIISNCIPWHCIRHALIKYPLVYRITGIYDTYDVRCSYTWFGLSWKRICTCYFSLLLCTYKSLFIKKGIFKNHSPWASYQIRKIANAHAPGMPGTFSPPPWVSDPDLHHGTCVAHVPWCMTGSLTSSFL